MPSAGRTAGPHYAPGIASPATKRSSLRDEIADAIECALLTVAAVTRLYWSHSRTHTHTLSHSMNSQLYTLYELELTLYKR